MANNSTFLSSNSIMNFQYSTNNNSIGNIGNYKVINKSNGAVTSLFKNSEFTVYPTGTNEDNGNSTGGASNIHNDDIYGISVDDIVQYTSKESLKSMKLTYADFAFLKNLGVYPNNRLVVARRFPAPVKNDLTSYKSNAPIPLATLMMWVPDEQNFMDNMHFGEYYESAEGSFKNILNSIGGDTSLSKNNEAGNNKLGELFSKGFSVISMPGMLEPLQRDIMIELGIATASNINDPILPAGNPNLIKEAKRRKTVDKDSAGSGLKYEFSYKMKIEYELKYINGNDCTFVYFDLLANILSFATSDSYFVYNQVYADNAKNFLSNLTSGNVAAVTAGIRTFVTALTTVLLRQASKIKDAISDYVSAQNTKKTEDEKTETPSVGAIEKLLKNTIGAVIDKYKIAILGVISALTGSPSTPWHITIGNPKRPFFCSGDMYADNFALTMGPELGYNDVPTSITVEFELKNARALGAWEIMNRFNTGQARSYRRLQTDISSDTGKISPTDTSNIVDTYTNFNTTSVVGPVGGG
jgi:hypothetical protein